MKKIKLFMSIFKARTDVYAKRWTINKTGKSGYSPVCRNEFSKYKCDKFNVKCSECVHRELEPLTEEIILKHLRGKITIGIYPLLLGDFCNFLAIDFDKKTYEKDVNTNYTLFSQKILLFSDKFGVLFRNYLKSTNKDLTFAKPY